MVILVVVVVLVIVVAVLLVVAVLVVGTAHAEHTGTNSVSFSSTC